MTLKHIKVWEPLSVCTKMFGIYNNLSADSLKRNMSESKKMNQQHFGSSGETWWGFQYIKHGDNRENWGITLRYKQEDIEA